MNSFIVLAIVSMAAFASAGTLLGGAALTSGPLTTTSLVSPLALHQAGVLSAPLTGGVLASPSWAGSPLLQRTISTNGLLGSPWVGSPLLQRTVSTHGVLGNPWVGAQSLVAQPALVHGGLVGARTIW